MICERQGCRRRARYAAIDLPEQDGARLGDEVAGMLLCPTCLRLSEADGEWDAVALLDAPWQRAPEAA
jgi:hypothetical protein